MVDLASLLTPGRTALEVAVASRAEAIDAVGALLVADGTAPASHVAAMHEREARVSTYLGAGVAVPHATPIADPAAADRPVDDGGAPGALALARFPDGVEWDGETAYVAIAVVARPANHTAILAAIASLLLDPERARALVGAGTTAQVTAALTTSSTVPGTPGDDGQEPSAAAGGDRRGLTGPDRSS
ncbi:PTS sugar transporter subunit IIA [Serinibacter arcticus]|uniref:Mannitol-specific phosphotransferase enzyme IIA component n=1 Tax=Serinibacter arcticus TaxID=1655435 RepID=A0A2U1ZXT2_9MICO|nr:PTS sugar transporter subunit IIA [Serinibacter arcticus]PWD51750.1 PTS sugar transporter subunit IIA [Serinibacter arcticus]